MRNAVEAVNATFTVVGRDYARVLGLPMLGGRDFTDAEMLPGSPERIAIIDDELAERLWPGEDALGRLIQLFDDEESDPAPPVRVVGIIPAVSTARGNPPSPHVYVPLGQHYESAMAVQLRVAEGEADRAMVANIARVARDLDERLPIVSVATWRDHVDAGLDALIARAAAGVFAAFGAIALLLAVLGVYGVKSYVVSRRTREFGIRIAIGAHPRALLWQVLREGGRITAIGIGHRPGAGRRRRAVPPGHPVRREQHRAGGAGDGAADPAGRVAPGLVHPGASRHESQSDRGAALRVRLEDSLRLTECGCERRVPRTPLRLSAQERACPRTRCSTSRPPRSRASRNIINDTTLWPCNSPSWPAACVGSPASVTVWRSQPRP